MLVSHKSYRKQKGQSGIDIPESMTTLDIQDTEQAKQRKTRFNDWYYK